MIERLLSMMLTEVRYALAEGGTVNMFFIGGRLLLVSGLTDVRNFLGVILAWQVYDAPYKTPRRSNYLA